MRERQNTFLQRLPGIVTPLMVIALSASLAKLLWVVLEPPQDVVAAPMPNLAQPAVSPGQPNLGRIIADNHLFGQAKRANAVTQPPPQRATPPAPPKPTAPPVKLNLYGIWSNKAEGGEEVRKPTQRAVVVRRPQKLSLVDQVSSDLDSLFGIPRKAPRPAPVVPKPVKRSSSSNKSVALIAKAGGSQHMYSEGESIEEGIKVLEIFMEKVVIDNRGARQVLQIGKDSPSSSSTASAGRSSQPVPPQARPRPAAAAVQQAKSAYSNPRGKRGENLGQRDLRALRESIIGDPTIIAQHTAPEPLILNGEVRGFRLHLSNRLRLLYQVGFRPGDVVTELNGVRLSDPSMVQEAMYNFVSSDQLAITVMRGQNEETFRYSFEE